MSMKMQPSKVGYRETEVRPVYPSLHLPKGTKPLIGVFYVIYRVKIRVFMHRHEIFLLVSGCDCRNVEDQSCDKIRNHHYT